MQWPSTLAESDALIVSNETFGRVRYVVYSCRGPQFVCRTYAEAEAHALAYAERAVAHAWYQDGRRLQLVSKMSPLSLGATLAPK